MGTRAQERVDNEAPQRYLHDLQAKPL
jgi:hypothetical protein